MYFPLLRSKQFELLALRELSTVSGISTIMSPIIEPVREDTVILDKAVQVLLKNDVNFNIVLNSCVVKDLTSCMNSHFSYISNFLSSRENYQIALNVNSQSDFNKIFEYVRSKELGRYRFSLIHNEQLDDLTILKDFTETYNVVNNVINFNKVSKRYYRNFQENTLVTLEDHFNQQARNLDYGDNIDEFFSEECFFYKEDGYVGFADYLTIGEQFSDSGFTPYAIAIHLTYADKESVRIRHFLSDKNNDTNFAADLAPKFEEALKKVIDFIQEKGLKTKATEEFQELYRKEHYPGLGSVKKLSIMHHIELMCQIIQSR